MRIALDFDNWPRKLSIVCWPHRKSGIKTDDDYDDDNNDNHRGI